MIAFVYMYLENVCVFSHIRRYTQSKISCSMKQCNKPVYLIVGRKYKQTKKLTCLFLILIFLNYGKALNLVIRYTQHNRKVKCRHKHDSCPIELTVESFFFIFDTDKLQRVKNISAVQKMNSHAHILHNKFQEENDLPTPERNAILKGSIHSQLRSRAVKKDLILESGPLKMKEVILPAKSQVWK